MEELTAEGWRLKKGADETLAAVSKEQHISLREAVLNADLRKVGDAALPEGISRTAGPLKGPHALQIVSCIDVGHPSKGGVTGSSAKRLLCLLLTDGRTTCKALEFRPIHGAEGASIAPGAKVLITGATVKAGIVLVDARSLKLLGGRVDELYEAWEFQNRFGGRARPAAAAGAAAELDRPPQFKTFVPGKTRAPKRLPADSGTNGHSAGVDSAAETSHARPAGREGRMDPPPGFESHPSSQKQTSLQHPPGTGNQSQAAMTAGRADAWHALSAGSAHDAAPQNSAPRAAMTLPGEAATRQLQGSSAAKTRLQERLAASEEDQRGRGRGRGGGRRGRYRDDEEEAGMTLGEWEAQQGAQSGGTAGAALSDEALARQLQRQLDMEDAELAAVQHDMRPPRSAEEDLRASLFAFDQPAQGGHDRGRGGFRRGGRGRGRGRTY